MIIGTFALLAAATVGGAMTFSSAYSKKKK